MPVQVQLDKSYVMVTSSAESFGDPEAKEALEKLHALPESRQVVVFELAEAKVVSLNALRVLGKELASGPKALKIAMIVQKTAAKFISDQGMDRMFPCFGNLREVLQAYQIAPGKEQTLEFLNTTLEAVVYTLQVSTNTKCAPGKTFLRGQQELPPVDIAATVGLVSLPFNGSLILAFPLKTYLGLMSKMLYQEYTEMVPEIRDGAAELLNIILGQVKISLNEKGYAIKQAIPTVVQGRDVQVTPSGGKPSVVVPYDGDAGKFYIELTTDTPRA